MPDIPVFPEVIDNFTVEQKNDGDTIFVQHIKELAEGIQRAEERIGTGSPEAPTHEQRITGAESSIAEETSRATDAETELDQKTTAEVTRATSAENTIAGNLSSEVTRATAAEALKANTADVESAYVKKSYALNGGTNPTYQMLKAITWNTDSYGHLQLHAWMRDLSGTTTTDIEDDFTPPLASSTGDGIMPKETFATVADLVNKVAALLGAIIPRGEIPEGTAEVTQEILTEYIEDTYERDPQAGDGIKDADNLTWVYNGSLWIKWGNDQVGQATNDDGQTTGSMGIVKGKNTDGYVFVENDGTLSVVGWDAFKSAFNTHTGNTNNPHSVTKSQVGLGNADNTSDANKPVSTAQATAIAAKQDKIAAGTAGNILTYSGTAGSVGSKAIDTTPTASSTNLITSGGVKTAVDAKQDKITATGTTNVLTAPASEGGQPGTKGIGAASGIAPLNASSKIDAVYLDDVVTDLISTTKSITLVSGKTYNCGTLTSLTITYPSGYFAAEVNFKCGSTVTTISVPAGTIWYSGKAPEIEANMSYRLTFQFDGFAVKANCGGYAAAA
ncbi:hypothetical protein NO1_0273 [Candidatus Termititenax aidoneus]|uniref:Phage tail fiber protein n=1 Tax=Termititenax aidoneus TaxID=2218524 RepID=A0A388T844_TERA1|nr:hypothetical protein NO1_0273 [Candidatus Termititenax aidoneus]